ncbi:hypothetical protein SUGI_0703690 [Cryptomeria japonica]|nr:hypothetical protein SUGI_0703690 [Cryptomeria japonica]
MSKQKKPTKEQVNEDAAIVVGERSNPSTPLPQYHQILQDMYNILTPAYATLSNLQASYHNNLEHTTIKAGHNSTPSTPLPGHHQILRDMYNILTPAYASLNNIHVPTSHSPLHSPIKQFQFGGLLDENMFGSITPITPQVDAAIAKKTMTRSPMEEPDVAIVEKKITRRHVEELEPFPGFMALTAFANAFHSLQPLRVPGWSFDWLELICHRSFMSKLLLSNNQKGWPFFQRLFVDLFKFMEPYLRNAELSYPVRLLYKGTLRVLLVLLHDFSEILCDYHFSFCDVIPPSCIQMRNLILSAFPRNMRLPDPFTPNIKVDLLPEISQSPRILSEVDAALKSRQIKTEVDEYLKTRQPMSMLIVDMKNRVLLPQHEAACARERELTDAADHEYYGCTTLYTSNYCKVH